MSFIFNLSFFIPLITFLNILFALTVIFLERKKPSSTWAWLLVLFFLPLAGFILYLMLGRQLRKKHLFRWEGSKDIGIDKLIDFQIDAIKNDRLDYRTDHIKDYNHLIFMNLTTNNAVLTQDNDVTIYKDGSDKFEALIEDILTAKDHIHIQYYIFKLDNLGQRVINAVIKKVNQGVKVRILYDEMGSRGVRKRHFKQLTDAWWRGGSIFPIYFTND